MKKTIFIVCVITLSISALLFFGDKTQMVFRETNKTVIIDAGHGLPDGGAVASDGTIESDINLIISNLLLGKLEKAGINCVATRKDENSIYSEGSTIHAKKVSDIRNRVKLANSNSDALVVSIHMNTYPNETVSGTQVFYSKNSELSKNIADEIQNVINMNLQPKNIKNSKPISSNIYFFNNISNDSILIECGFLTNKEDLSRLKNFDFQNRLTDVIAEAIIYKLSGSEIDGN